ncbi:MAG: hypothetical protein QM809_18720 [Gordonia sp. (in: high G+C Gram-positive bacteria)]|uniref:hypothetical protein n=1 Tax=Gordonia sp. (in: high G+C Gram-positive bacteria) TaxID=84139 RepID=UPI0039E376F7
MSSKNPGRREELGRRFPALSMKSDELLSVVDPLAEQILALHQPLVNRMTRDDVKGLRRARDLSPLANEHPVIRASLDRARNNEPPSCHPFTMEYYGEEAIREMEQSANPYRRKIAEAIRMGVDPFDSLSLHSDEFPSRVLRNTGRPPQPRFPKGREYTEQDLRDHDRNRRYYDGPHVTREIADADRLCELDYDRIARGGFPAQTVVVHNAPNDVGTIPYPVPLWTTPERVLLLAWHDPETDRYAECWHCQEWEDTGIRWLMMVSCGATLRVLPTCRQCRRRFTRDLPDGLDYLDLDDRSFFRDGWPDDAYRLV